MPRRSQDSSGAVEIARQVVMGLTPIAALLLFIDTRSWLWFVAIPVVGILLYGPWRRN